MKEYPQKYERLLGSPKKKRGFKVKNVSNDMGISTKDFTEMVCDFMLGFQYSIFEHLVKFTWLSRRFLYNGEHGSNVVEIECNIYGGNFNRFICYATGFDPALIRRLQLFRKIVSYFSNWFPEFDVHNPFESMDDYQYPYSTAMFEHLVLVYQMPERFELIAIAEERKLGYVDFVDYVVNYVECYNAEHGQTFAIMQNFNCRDLLHIRYLKHFPHNDVASGKKVGYINVDDADEQEIIKLMGIK